ncbi:Cystatin protein [Dioscorea alata]|uniref:Cystatin protein n=2 Tax=Dioscorea alata TaxID=55571 RepID=A0ACB7VVY0_DIOAL|nr:Cystatin protein [Dioscorea alata]KAH7678940.1 Cystatin protein [Dioscorea alata]
MAAPVLGGIKDLPGNENSAQIDDLARFAVQEHNKKQNTLLEFVKVKRARVQVVAGNMYYLDVEVNNGGKMEVYEAKIWVKLWENFKELQEFKPVGDSSS